MSEVRSENTYTARGFESYPFSSRAETSPNPAPSETIHKHSSGTHTLQYVDPILMYSNRTIRTEAGVKGHGVKLKIIKPTGTFGLKASSPTRDAGILHRKHFHTTGLAMLWVKKTKSNKISTIFSSLSPLRPDCLLSPPSSKEIRLYAQN